MNALQQSVLVFVGAGLGANARFWLSLWIGSRYATFPWATLLVNVSGSLLLGLLLGWLDSRSEAHAWRIFLGVGLLGGYTTFSTFSAETVGMLRTGHLPQALAYVAASTLLSVGAAYLGYGFLKGG